MSSLKKKHQMQLLYKGLSCEIGDKTDQSQCMLFTLHFMFFSMHYMLFLIFSCFNHYISSFNFAIYVYLPENHLFSILAYVDNYFHSNLNNLLADKTSCNMIVSLTISNRHCIRLQRTTTLEMPYCVTLISHLTRTL